MFAFSFYRKSLTDCYFSFKHTEAQGGEINAADDEAQGTVTTPYRLFSFLEGLFIIDGEMKKTKGESRSMLF